MDSDLTVVSSLLVGPVSSRLWTPMRRKSLCSNAYTCIGLGMVIVGLGAGRHRILGRELLFSPLAAIAVQQGTTRKSIVTKPQVGTTSTKKGTTSTKKGTGLKFFGK